MSASPIFKVYRSYDSYIACCKFISDAILLAEANGYGTTVRYGHAKINTIWVAGSEEMAARESYDIAAKLVEERIQKITERKHVSNHQDNNQ